MREGQRMDCTHESVLSGGSQLGRDDSQARKEHQPLMSKRNFCGPEWDGNEKREFHNSG